MGALAKAPNSFLRKLWRLPLRSVIIHGGISPPYFQQVPPPPRAAAAGVCVCWGQIPPADSCVERDLFYFFIAANAYMLFLRAAVRKSTIPRFIPSRIRVQTCTGREDGMDFFCSSGETCPTLTTRLSAVISERKRLYDNTRSSVFL